MGQIPTPEEFYKFKPGNDEFAQVVPQLKIDDLEPAFDGTPKLSILISTWNRKGQLSRSLECFARQEWKEFEVLIMDDGSTEDLKPLFDLFSNYLQLRTFRWERGNWRSCPSRAFKFMMNEVRGDVIAISHPEMMFHAEATKYIYQGCTSKIEDAYYGVIGAPHVKEMKWYWTSLRPNFIHKDMYGILDTVDWHSSLDNIQKLPDFKDTGGFAGLKNSWHATNFEYPWWFVGSAKKECPIWKDMPEFDGHGIIDMWMMKYRSVRMIVDVVPDKVLCYHQPHLTTAVAWKGEQESTKAQVE